MAPLIGTLEGSKGTASRTGTDLLRARLASWGGAVVVQLDDWGNWTVSTEPADPQAAAAAEPVLIARGNVHTGTYAGERSALGPPNLRPKRSPAIAPTPWTPYTIDERSPSK